MRLAILLGAEAYQAYHVADIACELAARDGVEVEIVALLPEALEHVARLERTPADRLIPRRLLEVPPHLRLLQKARVLGSLKKAVMRSKRNRELLSSYDAIITPTDHARVLRPLLNPLPAMIYVNHGIGGRAASYSDKYLGFDFVLVAGANDERRLLEKRRIRPGHYAVIGYPKFEAAERLSQERPALFDNGKQTVLLNPHSKRALRSWEKFARPLIDHATATGDFNLIVAPHAKLFGRRPRSEWKRWEGLAVPGRVIVDLGSERALDMSYALAADIYAGDVSSQVYEFLASPKPCVFLNAHRFEWSGNPDFPNWDLGDVVETPAQAIEAIRMAAERHHRYADRQRERMSAVVDPSPGAAQRGADAVLTFVRERQQKAATAKRVMILISDLGTGGTARATLIIANGLAEAAYEVSLLVTQPGGILTHELDPRIKLIEVEAPSGRGPAMLPSARAIARWIRSERPQVVLSAGNHMHVAATAAHRLSNLDAELALKLTNPIERPGASSVRNRLRRMWYARAFSRAARILTITRAAADELAGTYPAAAAKLRVVDNPYVSDAMLQLGASTRTIEPGRLLAIGRLVEQKDYPLLLRALARVKGEWSLDVLGDGPLRDDLLRLAEELGIARRVTSHGYVTDPLPFLAKAQALVLSSAWEGQGAVLIEALACGCPVIATRSTAAVGEVLGEGRFGKLVPPGDVDALAEAIDDLLEHGAAIAPETREWVERYTLDAGVRSHIEALGLG